MFHMKQKRGKFHVKHEIILSKELQKRLQTFEILLKKWQKAVNLVSNNSLKDVRKRHILDSAQLFAFVPKDAETLVDLGSGGGFPGLVLALMAHDASRSLHVHLVERDTRKCAFLQECARQLSVPVTIHNCRIEDMPALPADIITARALSDLPTLLRLSAAFWKDTTHALFLKGARVQEELARLPAGFTVQSIPSQTDPSGVIIDIRKEDS